MPVPTLPYQSVMHMYTRKDQSLNENWCPDVLDIPGQARLKISKKPQLVFDAVKSIVNVPSWGISVKTRHTGVSVDDLTREMARTFMRLLYAAKQQTLSDAESDVWRQILVSVDYSDYCEQVAPLTRTVGRRIKTENNGVLVEWSHGEREIIRGGNAMAMSIIDYGECFSALTKFRSFKLSEIRDVTPIPDFSHSCDDLSWVC